ncbi:hydrogenase nickel incorporation protein HypB, partial [Bacteroidota bacterium]
MCESCGCSESGSISIRKPGEVKHEHKHEHSHDGHTHDHSHNHSHNHGDTGHTHNHDHKDGREIIVEHDILSQNNLLAERNRGFFEAKNIYSLNMVSSPGSGKTSLLERTIKELGKEIKFYVIEGDQQTMNDADRISSAGAPVVQINTGNGCHLDADMINKAVKKLEPENDSFLVIENVGNLVCPSLFDLGESSRIVIISVTEGEDKPIKYPTMFQSADICIINKTDLLPYVDFDMKKCIEYA